MQPRGEGYRRLAVAFTASFMLVGGVALGYLVGAWADRRLGSDPWLAVAGVVLGAAAGLHAVLRQLLAQDGGGRPPRGGPS